MNAEELMANIAKHSSVLCRPENLNRKASGAAGGGSYDAAAFDNAYLQAIGAADSTPAPASFPAGKNNSRMPKAIRESMEANPIEVNNPLDPLSSVNLDRYMPQPTAPTPAPAPASASIDYGVLRALINDCLDEKLKNLGMLSEITLKGGKIILTDNKGNVYSARLEKEN